MSKPNHRQIGFIAGQLVAVAALLFSTYFLNRLAGFTAICFNSQIIDRFVLFSERIEVPHCQKNWGAAASIGDVPSQWTLQWPRITAKLDRILEVWPVPARGYQMIVVSQDPFLAERNGSQILLGGALAMQPDNWLRELVRIWVADSTAGQSELEQLILADFLSAVGKDGFTVAGLGGSVRGADQIVWQNSASGPRDYCLSPWRDPKDFDSCDPENPDELRGLKTMFSRALWEIYRQANWSERRSMWRWLRDEVAQGRESLLYHDSSGIAVIEKFNETLSHWSKQVFATPERQARVLFHLKTRLGIKAAASPFMLVEADRGLEVQWGKYKGLVRINGITEWWSRSDRLNAFPGDAKPLHWVRISCDVPTLGQLAKLSIKTVLFVRSCNPETLAGWDSLSQHDFKSFIAANPDVGVIWLNAQGLRQALQSESMLMGSRISLGKLRHTSQWREDAWDKSALAFKPAAAIDLVLSHRATRELL